MWNTLWVDYVNEAGQQPMLLRTHTLADAGAGDGADFARRCGCGYRAKCYRYEATDATHEWHFYQVEGLAVDAGITFADLKGTLYEFAPPPLWHRAQGTVPLRLLPLCGTRRRYVHRLLCLPGRHQRQRQQQ